MARPVLCIMHDLDGFRRWRENGVMENRVVLTWNDQVYRECTTAGIQCLDAIETVGAESMDGIYKAVIDAAETWWQPQLSGLSHKGVDLARCMGRDMLYAFLDGMGSQVCMSRVLDTIRPEAVEVVDCGRRAFFWDPPGGPFPGFANGVALWEAEQRGIPASIVLEQPTWSPPPHRRNAPPGDVPGFEGQDGLSHLFLLSGVDHARLRPILTPVFKGPERTFLARAGEYEAPEAAGGQLAWYDWLSHFPPNSALCRDIAQRFSGFAQGQNGFQTAYPYLFDNPHVAFQWNAFRHQLELGGRIVDATNHLLEALDPDVLVIGTATLGPWRCVTDTARGCGVPVASVHHSAILSEWLLCGIWRHEADALLIEGKITRDMYERWGRTPDSLVEIGYPLMQHAKRTDTPDGPILIVPNEWDYGFAQPAYVISKRVDCFKELTELMRAMPDRSFVLKTHPKALEQEAEAYRLAGADTPNLTIVDPRLPLATLMEEAAVIIMLNSCSQAYLDGCLSGTPIIHHRPAVLDARCNDSSQDLGYAPTTQTVSALRTELESLLSDDACRRSVIARGDDFIHDFSVAADVGTVRDNLLAALASMAQQKEALCCS